MLRNVLQKQLQELEEVSKGKMQNLSRTNGRTKGNLVPIKFCLLLLANCLFYYF